MTGTPRIVGIAPPTDPLPGGGEPPCPDSAAKFAALLLQMQSGLQASSNQWQEQERDDEEEAE